MAGAIDSDVVVAARAGGVEWSGVQCSWSNAYGYADKQFQYLLIRAGNQMCQSW